jgi:Xaa-Pro aminopeptidase
VGLEVHERPSLGEAGEATLKSGQVVTVEPGLYYPDLGGVRLEDLVVVEKDGCHNLTRLQRKLVV